MATGDVGLNELFDVRPEMVRCPYAVYADLRSEAPVRWVDRVQAYVVTRYSDIMEILRSPQVFSSGSNSGPTSVTPLARQLVKDPSTSPTLRAQAERRLEMSECPVLVNADPPEHLRQRKLVNKAFTARRIRAMEPAVEQLAHQLIDAFGAHGEVELVSQFSMPLPITVIANMLGVPSELGSTFKRWSDAFVAGVGNMGLSDEQVAEVFAAIDEFYDYFTDEIDQRRTNPRDDLLSDLVAARLDGATPLSLNEMLQMIVQFLVGGNETTTSLVTSMMFTLVTDRELMTAARTKDDVIPRMVEEMLRLESPVQGVFRTATEEVEVAGLRVPAGSNLWLVFGAANRDERVYADPDSPVIDWPAERNHLAFGQGEHFCLGAPLGRLEARIGVTALLDRLPNIQLLGDPREVRYRPSFMLHGIDRLPLRFTAHAAVPT